MLFKRLYSNAQKSENTRYFKLNDFLTCSTKDDNKACCLYMLDYTRYSVKSHYPFSYYLVTPSQINEIRELLRTLFQQ